MPTYLEFTKVKSNILFSRVTIVSQKSKLTEKYIEHIDISLLTLDDNLCFTFICITV